MMTRPCCEVARPIAIDWRWPPDSCPTSAVSEGRLTRRSAHHLARALEHLLAIDEEAPADRLAAEIEVGRHVAHVDQGEVLKDGGDAELARRLRVADPDRVAADLELAAVRLMDAAEDLDQRRLAGAVVADDRQHLAFEHVEVDVLQGADVTEALRESPGLQVGARRSLSAMTLSQAARRKRGQAPLPVVALLYAKPYWRALASQMSVRP